MKKKINIAARYILGIFFIAFDTGYIMHDQ